MTTMKSNRDDVLLLRPDVERDAPFALGWFSRAEGRQTLLSMGNAQSEIEEATLDGEKVTIQEFIDLEKENRQITRMIVIDDVTIGAVWIELLENHGVKSPSVHIIIGNPDYRGKGIGTSTMQSAIRYSLDELGATNVYSRHLSSNKSISAVNAKLGFKADGDAYEDENGLIWQNVKFEASSSRPRS